MSAKPFFIALIGLLLCTSPVTAQDASVDKIITDLYQSISFDQDKKPDYERFKSLFTDGAQLISVRDTSSYRLTPSNYEKMMNEQRSSGKLLSFVEEELHRKTDHFGNIIQVFSTYMTHLKTPNATDSARGINSIQLIKKNGKWKVASIIWYRESKDYPIPEKYLPSN